MWKRTFAVCGCVFLLVACRNAGQRFNTAASPVGPSSVSEASQSRPWDAHLSWLVTGVHWAGIPGQTKSLFEGRCSIPSDYIVTAKFEGEATHAGRITGETAHCTQITWSPQGQPLSVTYSDGRASVVAADGSRMAMTYGNGVTGVDASTGETWFRDDFILIGETGRFEGASGAGQEGGRFMDFGAVLVGAPVPMWMKGTITYDPRRAQE